MSSNGTAPCGSRTGQHRGSPSTVITIRASPAGIVRGRASTTNEGPTWANGTSTPSTSSPSRTVDEYPFTGGESMRSYLTEASRRAAAYCERKRLRTEKTLGWGQDGIVLSTNRPSAVKAFGFEPQYGRERDVYKRLHERNLSHAAGFSIPKLIDFHDEFLVIEMAIVMPPSSSTSPPPIWTVRRHTQTKIWRNTSGVSRSSSVTTGLA
jgi:hypothetical protein